MQETDPDFWKWLAGTASAALGGLSLWVVSIVNGTVKEKADAAAVVTLAAAVVTLAAEVKAKADEKMVDSVIDRLDTIINNQRTDVKNIFDKIDETNKTHSLFAQKIAEEMGKRPTRDEWRETDRRSSERR